MSTTIIELRAQNVKRLHAVTIRPDGAIVQISGRNGAGKSSVLDSIAMVLGGREWLGQRPIREGADKGEIVLQLSNGLTVRRTLTAGGGSLTITKATGERVPSPQTVLDLLASSLAFDPLAFSRMSARDQVETLKRFVGLDFAAEDQRRADLYQDRTDINRRVKALQSQIAGIPLHPYAPAQEVSVAELMRKLSAAEQANRDVEAVHHQRDAAERRAIAAVERVNALKAKLSAAERERDDARASIARLEQQIKSLTLRDTTVLREEISSADVVNRKVRENAARTTLIADLDRESAGADALTRQIEQIDESKRQRLAAARFPVYGLSFDDAGVLYNGLPFAQASSAEQLRVSVAMGLAMSPDLKVMLVRDGSLLDEDSLALMADMAEEHGAQIWIETVDSSGQVGIVIEDGAVVNQPALA